MTLKLSFINGYPKDIKGRLYQRRGAIIGTLAAMVVLHIAPWESLHPKPFLNKTFTFALNPKPPNPESLHEVTLASDT